MPELAQSITQLRPELIQTSENIDKTIIFFDKAVVKERRLKASASVKDSPVGFAVYNKAFYNFDYFSGGAKLSSENVNIFDVFKIVPDNDFIEIFQSDYLIDKVPDMDVGKAYLGYNEVLESKDLYYYNDYSVSYTTEYKNGYPFLKPVITDNLVPISYANVSVKGDITYEKGADIDLYYNFDDASAIAKYNTHKYSYSLYAGGTSSMPGTYTNISVDLGRMYCTDGTSGTFISDILYSASKDIDNIEIIASETKNSGEIKYYVNADGSNTWQEVFSNDGAYTLAMPGKDLRIKISIEGDAYIDDLRLISYSYITTEAISDKYIKLYVGNESDGWLEASLGNDKYSSYNRLRYKIVNITPDSVISIRRVRVRYG